MVLVQESDTDWFHHRWCGNGNCAGGYFGPPKLFYDRRAFLKSDVALSGDTGNAVGGDAPAKVAPPSLPPHACAAVGVRRRRGVPCYANLHGSRESGVERERELVVTLVSVLGSWVGVRRPFHLSLFLTASRMVLPQDPSTDHG